MEATPVDIWLRRGARVGACFGYLAVAVLSLVPGEYRPHAPGSSDKLEHLSAYIVLGALTVIAVRPRLNAHLTTLAIIAYAGVLELGQLFIPGRVAALDDFVASAAGAIIGTSLTVLALRRSARI